MSYKQKWTRFTLALVVLLAASAWGLFWLGYWLYRSVTISWGA